MIENTILEAIIYAIFFLVIVLIAIIIFIVKSRLDRANIERQKQETEENLSKKTVLLQEIHHRVKNNLQLVSGLLYLQSKKYKNPEVELALNGLQKYINSIALVHEMLYNEKTLSLVNMKKYVEDLVGNLLKLSDASKITLKIKIEDLFLSVNYATTLGLILNELITNSLKHAFEKEEGNIFITIEKSNNYNYKFEYKDDGVGMDLKKSNSKTLGLKLIKMFSEEIDADLKVKNENGLVYVLNFQCDNNG